jgi:hypothetical protein
MSHADKRDAGPAILVAVAAAVAGYIPAVLAWDAGMRWIMPMRHAEEALGRGLEAMFVGGPIGALLIAGLAGWLTYRAGDRVTTPIALALVVAAVALVVAVAKYNRLF